MPDPLQFTNASPRFRLPYLFTGQAQKEFYVNEAHALTDLLLHTAVEASASEPPLNPLDGQMWRILTPATGAWAGQENKLAAWQSSNWLFIPPAVGMRIFNRQSQQFELFSGEWKIAASISQPIGGQTIDSELRAAFASLVESLSIAGIFPVIE